MISVRTKLIHFFWLYYLDKIFACSMSVPLSLFIKENTTFYLDRSLIIIWKGNMKYIWKGDTCSMHFYCDYFDRLNWERLERVQNQVIYHGTESVNFRIKFLCLNFFKNAIRGKLVFVWYSEVHVLIPLECR